MLTCHRRRGCLRGRAGVITHILVRDLAPSFVHSHLNDRGACAVASRANRIPFHEHSAVSFYVFDAALTTFGVQGPSATGNFNAVAEEVVIAGTRVDQIEVPGVGFILQTEAESINRK